MTKFYSISRNASKNPTTLRLLKEACDKQGLDFVLIESEDYNFAKPLNLKPGSCLYQLSIDEKSWTVFTTLARDDVAMVFKDTFSAVNFKDNVKVASILHQKAGLPIIKTVFDITRDKPTLKTYAEYLGGFPLIVKSVGGSHGIGVIKVDSFEALLSLADYLIVRSKSSPPFIMRQYIDYKYNARLIVLDGKVIDSINYHRVPEDFRANAGQELTAVTQKFSNEVEQTAISAVEALGSDFGGVDILINKKGTHYLAEVNIPCFFPRAQLITGKDIASSLVNSLYSKAVKLS